MFDVIRGDVLEVLRGMENDARLIVPYCGSGSEMLGALEAGWNNVTGIEREASYADIAQRRLEDFYPLLVPLL